MKSNHTETFSELLALLEQYKEAPALTDASEGTTLSYSDLCQKVSNFSKQLPDLPVGTRVVLYDLSPLDWVPLFFAIALRGWIVVPLDTRVSTEFFHSVEKLTEPSLIIVGDSTQISTNSITVHISDLKKHSISSHKLPPINPNAAVEILFTSGTWALPKGVVLSQRNILTNAHQILEAYHHKHEDVSLAVLPLSHAYQQTAGLMVPLLKGSQIVFLTQLNSEALSHALRTYKIRTMLVVPRVLSLIENGLLRKIKSFNARKYVAAIVRAFRFLPRPVRRFVFRPVHKIIGKNLTTLVVGGAPLSLELDHFFQGLGYKVLVGYGVSECSPTISISFNQHRRLGEVGQPLPGIEVQFNEKEEMLMKGENIFLGYWPNLTRPDVFNTEDVGSFDNRGNLLLKGRTKNLVVYPNGDKIFCEDVEHLVSRIAGVEDCCVVGISSPQGTQLHCVIKGEALLKGKEESIRENINKALPFGVRLDRVIFIERDEFPYTHTLKPNRQKIHAICTTSASALLPN